MSRVEILKTYKLYIGGKFPRTESGRYFQPEDSQGNSIGNICQASRKDFRNAVVAARGAQGEWAGRSAYNRSQILYRIGEMLEGRKEQFVAELAASSVSPKAAREEVVHAVDRCIYYAGWCDKYQQVFSSVNPVSSAHFNFSVLEPCGVVAALAPQDSALLGLVGTLLPLVAGGNTCVLLASEQNPLCAITFAEVLATSDLPGGVVNLLTGLRDELLPVMASHMDVNAFVASDISESREVEVRQAAVDNLKRIVIHRKDIGSLESPYAILDTQEVKTTWHPIESSIAAGSKY